MAKIRLERRTSRIVLQLFGAFGMVVAAGCGSSDSGGKKDSAPPATEAGRPLDSGSGPEVPKPPVDAQPAETPVQQPEAGIVDVTPPLDTPKLDVAVDVQSPDRPEAPRIEVGTTEAGTGGVGGGTGAGGTAGGTGTGSGGSTSIGSGGATSIGAGGATTGSGGSTTVGSGGATAAGGEGGTTTATGGATAAGGEGGTTTATGGTTTATGGTTTATGGTTTATGGTGGGTTVLLPELTIAPTSVALGTLNCGTGGTAALASASSSLKLTNSGTGIMDVSNYVLSGAQFASTLATPITMDPGAERNVPVTFSATARSTPYTGTISVETNETSGSPHTVNLSATVNGVTLEWGVEGLASNTIELGGVPTGYTIEKPFTVSNTGSTGSSVTLTLNANSSDCEGSFVICPPTGATTSCPTTTTAVTLAGGESASYRLVFTAPATVPISADGGTGTKNCSAQITSSHSSLTNLCNELPAWTALAEAGQNAPLIVKPAAFYGAGQNIGVGSTTAMTLTAPCGSSPDTQTLAIQNNGYNPVYFNCVPNSTREFAFGGVGCPGSGSGSNCIGVEPGHEVHLDIGPAPLYTDPFAQNENAHQTGSIGIQFYTNDYCNAPFGANTTISLVATPLGDRLAFSAPQLSGTTFAFGAIPLSTTGPTPAADRTLAVRNAGFPYPSILQGTVDTTANVTFSLENDADDNFDLVGTTTFPLAAGDPSQNLTIRYKGPLGGVATSTDTATLRWTVAETNTCMAASATGPALTTGTISLTGSVSGTYLVSLGAPGDSRGVNFGNIFCGAQATPQTINVTNVGTGTVRLTSFSNTNGTQYTVTPPGACAAGAGCTCSPGPSCPGGVVAGHCVISGAGAGNCNVSVTPSTPAVFTITPARMDPAWITGGNYSSYLAATSPTAFATTVVVNGSVNGAGSTQFTSQTFTEYAQGLYFGSASPVAPTAWNLGEVQWPGPPLASEMSATLSAAGNTPAKLWLNVAVTSDKLAYMSVSPATLSPTATVQTIPFNGVFGTFNDCRATSFNVPGGTTGSLTITPDLSTAVAQNLNVAASQGLVGLCGTVTGVALADPTKCSNSNADSCASIQVPLTVQANFDGTSPRCGAQQCCDSVAGGCHASSNDFCGLSGQVCTACTGGQTCGSGVCSGSGD